MGFSVQTIITDLLSATGFAILILGPLFYSISYKKFFKRHLFLKEDGAKIFEKLKYDLRVNEINGVDRSRLYRDLDYALTIFKNSMEFNKRDLMHYFNERKAIWILKKNTSQKSWFIFLVWTIFFATCFASSRLDIIFFIFNGLNRNSPDNGYSSIVFLFIIAVIFNANILIFKYFSFRKNISTKVRKINLVKYEKISNNFKYVYIGEIFWFVLALFFIFLNTFF
ncbi:hypothetical protein SALLE_v1c04280 [Spiroplasma alleghenense]|uniref:Uncharacterized protein n=1 Tax=Spiroplasma alleghenense TaxID=216931 RepID=A0A345Z3C3_9MOLU|nr:hypothetical protein SALLE_v1c04280 [Spiroplasma alleghenense]